MAGMHMPDSLNFVDVCEPMIYHMERSAMPIGQDASC